MNWFNIHAVLIHIQHAVSLIGIFIIISGVLFSFCQYIYYFSKGELISQSQAINTIRLTFGRVLILGLEFIVAADLIGTTNTPDYYAVGLLAIIVVIRTVLSFSINRELMSIKAES
jgi:uncharacterized membrane protein